MEQSSNENVMCLTYFDELQTENSSLLLQIGQSDDDDDDDALLSVPSLPNNRKNCSSYWLHIFICSIIILCLILSIIGITFGSTRISNVSNEFNICKTSSISGKSCSYKVLQTLKLMSSTKSSQINNDHHLIYFSSIYIASSNLSIVTFVISKGSNISLTDISMIDTENNTELIQDGHFTSKTTNSFCLCGSSSTVNIIKQSLLSSSTDSTDKYVCQIDNSVEDIRLSQTINTIDQRKYNISFAWQKSFSSLLTLYISSSK